jgi:hypothetical protein
MSNNINWMGNKVLDSGAPRQPSTSPAQPPVQQSRTTAPPATPYIPPAGQAFGPYTPAPGTSLPTDGVDLETVQGPPPAAQPGFIPYYLASNIGRPARAEFIVGTSQYMDKTGVIKEVGINYFVLYDTNARADVMCDLYSVKFVTIPRV